MKELYQITPNKGGKGFTMMLANGNVTVPDEGGCYIISPGCGSGKTECCKGLIREKANSGILYCVDTISELQKMDTWIKTELCGPGGCLRESDVVCISSDGLNREDLECYRDNPSLLTKKKVILLTHVRFWTDLINYFLVYNPGRAEGIFDGDFERLMARNDLRGYVIFDETPTFIKPFVKLPKWILGFFGIRDGKGKWKCMERKEMTDKYNRFLKDTKDEFFGEKHLLQTIKKHVVLNMIPRLYDRWLMMDEEEVAITFTPADLAQKTVNTHVLVFEGAGDVLFSGSGRYKLLDIKRKYDAKMIFSQIPINKKRRDVYTDPEKQYIANRISGIVGKESGKTLVVVWQTVGVNARDRETDDPCFADEIRKLMPPEIQGKCQVTHFGSNRTKSTNEFRDFDNIILWGRWNIPNTDTQRFKACYGTETSNLQHVAWYYIQLLCRIGIRRHGVKKEYHVYYTSDYDKKLIEGLNVYINENRNVLGRTMMTGIESVLKKKGINKKVRSNIVKLAEHDRELKRAISSGATYSFSMSARELYMLIPVGGKPKKYNYNSITKSLSKLNITLKVT